MKKIVLILILCFSTAGLSFAQNNTEGMKALTINALMEYGQSLYDRGDYNEATAVFNHVLTFDSHQAQALEYIKEMGSKVVEKSDAPALEIMDGPDTESLKQAIEAKKQSIEKLRAQITQLRANIKGSQADE
jgi:hypothetical protein